MAIFNLKKIVIKNFIPFESVTLEVENGKHLVCGDNGAGKSTLLTDSLSSCLFNKGRSKTPTLREGRGSIQIYCTVNDVEYEIERIYPDPDRICPLIKRDGEPLNFKNASAREAEIKNILGVSYDLFFKTLVVKQGQLANFGYMSPTMRKSFIEEIVGFSIWDDLKKQFQKHLKSKEEELKIKQYQTSQTSNEMVGLDSRLKTYAEMEETKNDKMLQIAERIYTLKQEIEKQEKRLERLPKIQEKTAALPKFESLKYQTQANLNNQKHIQNTKDCPTCRRPFPEEQMEAAAAQIPKLEDKLKKLEEKIQKLRQLEQVGIKLRNDYDATRNEIAHLEASKKSLDTEVDFDGMETQLESLAEKVNVFKSELSGIEGSYENISYIQSLLSPSSQFRTNVLAKQVLALEELANEIAKSIFPEIQIEIPLTARGIGFAIIRDGKRDDYQVFSGGEKRRIDVILVFAFQKFLSQYSGIHSNFIVLDEIFDGLDLNGINSVLNTVNDVYPDAQAIYVISHKEEIKQAFNSVIRVKKSPDGSYIEKQEGYVS